MRRRLEHLRWGTIQEVTCLKRISDGIVDTVNLQRNFRIATRQTINEKTDAMRSHTGEMKEFLHPRPAKGSKCSPTNVEWRSV